MASRMYAYYPGCSMHGSAKEYDASTQLVMRRLGIELHEIEAWTCCGASSAHATSRLLGYALPARNLQIAEKMGMPLTSSCLACFSRLKFTVRDVAADAELRALVGEAIGEPFHGKVDMLPILVTVSPGDIAPAVRKPLRGLKLACYTAASSVSRQTAIDRQFAASCVAIERAANLLARGAITVCGNVGGSELSGEPPTFPQTRLRR